MVDSEFLNKNSELSVKFLENSNINLISCLLNLNATNMLWRFNLIGFLNIIEKKSSLINWLWLDSSKNLILKFFSVIYQKIDTISGIFVNKLLKYLPFSSLSLVDWAVVWYSVLLKLINKTNYKLNLNVALDLDLLNSWCDKDENVLAQKDEISNLIVGILNNPVDMLQYNQLNPLFLIDVITYNIISSTLFSYVNDTYKEIKEVNGKRLTNKLIVYFKNISKCLASDIVETNFMNLIEVYKAFNNCLVGLNILEYKKNINIVKL